MLQRRLDLLELLLDFEDPLDRLDPEDTDRAGEELLETELDLVTVGVLLDLRLVDEVERVTEDSLGAEYDLDTLDSGLLRLTRVGCSEVFGGEIL